jgi:tryptophan halogenase
MPAVKETYGNANPLLRVVVVGGGSAGYLTALTLERLVANIEVSVLDPDTISTIGVGESTTSEMPPFLHHVLGLDVERFYREVQPTWKLGIKFIWGAPGEYFFNYPFDRGSLLEPYVYDGDIRSATLGTALMSTDRTPLLDVGSGSHVSLLDVQPYGYHIDNARFLVCLSQLARERGIRISSKVVSEVLTGPRGMLSGLRFDDSSIESFDLYLDCTGFRALILGHALHTPFVSFSDSLYCDTACTGTLDHNGLIKPYTTAETMDNGWLWNIPQRNGDHIGYVFSSAHCSAEGARLELQARYPGVKSERLINFRSGRLQRWISGNVLAIGNAFGFVEPLESTALFMTTRQCLLAARNLRALAAGDLTTAARLNAIGISTWDYLRWFLAVHYRFNRRADTPFWRDCRSTVDVSGAEPILLQYQESAPRFGMEGASASQLSTNFDAFGYDVLLLGQHVPVALRPPQHDIETYRASVTRLRLLTDAAIPQDRALSAVENEGAMLTRHIASNQSWLAQFNAHLAKVC